MHFLESGQSLLHFRRSYFVLCYSFLYAQFVEPSIASTLRFGVSVNILDGLALEGLASIRFCGFVCLACARTSWKNIWETVCQFVHSHSEYILRSNHSS
jgi:hypothetical protein